MLALSILESFSGRLLSHVHGLSCKRAFPVTTNKTETDLQVSTVSTRRYALTNILFDVFIL